MNKRMISLFAILCIGILSLFIRILYVGTEIASEAVNESHYSTVEIGTSRGKIYDRNLDLLVEKTDRLVAAVTPSTAALEMLSKSLKKIVDFLFFSKNAFDKFRQMPILWDFTGI